MLFIFLGSWAVVFIFIIIFTTFRPMCRLAFFTCFLSNSGTYTELRTTSFIQSTGDSCSDSVNHNWVQELSIPVLLLACSQDWICNILIIITKKLREAMPITVTLCVLLGVRLCFTPNIRSQNVEYIEKSPWPVQSSFLNYIRWYYTIKMRWPNDQNKLNLTQDHKYAALRVEFTYSSQLVLLANNYNKQNKIE